MEHIAAFMILVACSEDLGSCEQKQVPSVAFETLQQCQAELSPLRRMASDVHGKTFGACVEVDPALFYEDAEIVWHVTAQDGLTVQLELLNPEMSIVTIAQAPSPNDIRQIN
ncbi:hypothetical protein [Hoeflea sp.]|uniref:hypothetical protein n=1 Tax=Hoeflea sp. TaxID=1940281 RepID=UPI00374A4E0E